VCEGASVRVCEVVRERLSWVFEWVCLRIVSAPV
jgi:hypothetical protein